MPATQYVKGIEWMERVRDKEGHRTYKIKYLLTHDPYLGPATLRNTPFLPLPGSFWDFGAPQFDGAGHLIGIIPTEVDSYAFCYWADEIRPISALANEPCTQSEAIFTFSTRPENKFCRTSEVQDPLLEPYKVSGSFNKYTEEALYDRFGVRITNSAWEQIKGPQNEWDKNRITIKLENNVGSANQGYILPGQMIDCVNAAPLWGFPARTIKLSTAPWEAKFWGSCALYYTRTLEFEIRYTLLADGYSIETWDRDIMDEGTKVLNGQWNSNGQWVNVNVNGQPPNPNNPTHFIKATDFSGNLCKILLNGQGNPGAVTAPSTRFFVATAAGTGNTLDNANFWMPMAGNPNNPAVWVGDPTGFVITAGYPPGAVVTYSGQVYINKKLGINHTVPTDPSWVAATLANTGVWAIGTAYTVGQYVIDGTQTTAVGTRHVERYPGVDFTLLGIPLSF